MRNGLGNSPDPGRCHRYSREERLLDDEGTVFGPDRRYDEHVNGCERLSDLLVRNRPVNADKTVGEKRSKFSSIAVVAVIGTRRTEQIDGDGAAREPADGFEKHVRRLRHHQTAEKPQPQLRRTRALRSSERTIIESIRREDDSSGIHAELDEAVAHVTRRSKKHRDVRAHM